jgi:saccharopine dehydrogenase-like NADP-dependent oxidoreductase
MITGKTIVVLGGWGLVGRAVCHELLQDNPARLVVCSLTKDEADEAVRDLEKERGQMNEMQHAKIATKIIGEYGDIFAREEFKDRKPSDIRDPKDLEKIIDDTFLDLKKINIKDQFLYDLILKYRPNVLVDAINTATILAYKDVYSSVLDLRLKLAALEQAHARGTTSPASICPS